MSPGYAHTCGLMEDGNVNCWGYNAEGQTDVPENVFEDVSAGANYNCGINEVKALQCWGDDTYNQSTPP